MSDRINWAKVPDTMRLSCGCVIIDGRLMINDDCTSPIGHAVYEMTRADEQGQELT